MTDLIVHDRRCTCGHLGRTHFPAAGHSRAGCTTCNTTDDDSRCFGFEQAGSHVVPGMSRNRPRGNSLLDDGGAALVAADSPDAVIDQAFVNILLGTPAAERAIRRIAVDVLDAAATHDIYDEAIAIIDGIDDDYYEAPDSTGEPTIWAVGVGGEEPVAILRRYALPVSAYPLWPILVAAVGVRKVTPQPEKESS